jgi:hypothetical protein
VVAIFLEVDPWVTCPGHFKDVMTPAYAWFAKKLGTEPQQMAKPEVRA